MMPALRAPAGGRSRLDPHVVCDTCAVGYRAALTAWACPVCGTPAPQAPARAGARLWDDPDTRVLAIVGAATLLNILLLAILAALAL